MALTYLLSKQDLFHRLCQLVNINTSFRKLSNGVFFGEIIGKVSNDSIDTSMAFQHLLIMSSALRRGSTSHLSAHPDVNLTNFVILWVQPLFLFYFEQKMIIF